jgi:peptide/nickel transport system permease protein
VQQYIIKRLLMLIPVLFVVSLMAFALMRMLPGDAALLMVSGSEEAISDPEVMEVLRHQLGLDKPYLVQYVEWIWNILRYGDMGTAFWTEEPVTTEIMRRLPITVELAIGTVIISLFIAIPIGIIAAVRQDTLLDYTGRFASVAGLSMPGFWIGTLFIVFAAIWFGYLPPPGYTPPWVDPWANFQQFIFPCLTMGIHDSARSMRMTRSQMLEVVRQDYIRTAWAKGLRERSIILRHALRNAVIPVVTIVGLDFGYLLGRTVVVETVFSLPGLGSLTLAAIMHRDYPQIQGNILVIAATIVVVNFLVDIIYAVIDPRIRYR